MLGIAMIGYISVFKIDSYNTTSPIVAQTLTLV